MRSHALALLALVLPGVARADLLRVDAAGGPGVDHDNLQDAVDAASEGDVILIAAGQYVGFDLSGKSLTLVAEPDAAVAIQDSLLGLAAPVSSHAAEIRDLGAHQEVVLRGLSFRGTHPLSVHVDNVDLHDNQGRILIEDCDLVPTNAESRPLRAVNCADLVLTRCALARAETPPEADVLAVLLRESNVSFYECVVFGGHGETSLVPGVELGYAGNGVRQIGGSTFAADTTFWGGDAQTSPLGQCALDGGFGFQLLSGQLTHLGSSFLGGAPAGCVGGGMGAPGLGLDVDPAAQASALPGEPRRLTANSPVPVGGTLTETYAGVPGDLVFLLYATTSLNPLSGLPWAGTLVPGQPFFVSPKGVLDASGTTSTSASIAGAPAARAAVLQLQAAHLDAQLELWLSSPSSVVVYQP